VLGSIIQNRYLLEQRIGAGGLAAVYRARHLTTGRAVAIKILHRFPDDEQHEAWRRFEREARAAGTLDTPHVAQVIDMDVDGETGAPFIVMELLAGEDLRQVFKRCAPLPVPVALKLAAQACTGLSVAHARGIVHRDVKPANLFLADGGADTRVVKLLDFGIAKALGEETERELTHTGDALGTPAYMAPEQIRGAKDVDARADLWSLGVVLHAALSGHTPFEDAPNAAALLASVLAERPPSVQSVAPWVPADVAVLVAELLEPNREQRIESAEVLLARLSHLLGGSDLALRGDEIRSATDEERRQVQEPARLSTRGELESTGAALAQDEPIVPSGRRRKLLLPALAAVAVGVAVIALAQRPASTPSSGEAAPPPAPVAEPSTVGLEVHVTPSVPASVVVGDQTQTGARTRFALRRDSRPVRVRVSATGYEPRALEVVPSVDRVLDVVMQPSATAATPTPKPAAAAQRAVPAKASASALPSAEAARPPTRVIRENPF
jgi:serine/threonine-protein kinase